MDWTVEIYLLFLTYPNHYTALLAKNEYLQNDIKQGSTIALQSVAEIVEVLAFGLWWSLRTKVWSSARELQVLDSYSRRVHLSVIWPEEEANLI